MKCLYNRDLNEHRNFEFAPKIVHCVTLRSLTLHNIQFSKFAMNAFLVLTRKLKGNP